MTPEFVTTEKWGNVGCVPRVSLFIGTKAQLIKMIPVAWELDRRGMPYRLINTGQHESISADLRKQYAVREPDSSLGNKRSDVNTLGKGLTWLAGNLAQYGLRGGRTKQKLFDDTAGIVLVHGDTASTLLSSIIAKRAGQKVMHIEAGLRSWRVLNPFPEELVRILVMRMSDYLIAPSAQAHENLAAMSLAGRCWRVAGNTGMDIVAADLCKSPEILPDMPDSYGVVTIHRLETLYQRSRLDMVVDTIIQAHNRAPVLFVQHVPTTRRLAAYGMLDRLRQAGVRMLELLDHTRFVHLLRNAQFVITDGGSVQEESGYLGTPCLLMRLATERPDGLDANVVLSEMDAERIDEFVNNYSRYRRPAVEFDKFSPSGEIVDILESVVPRPG